MYAHIYDICQNIEKVMGMFSKELRELDRNTVQLMIDEMQGTINEQQGTIQELQTLVDNLRKELAETRIHKEGK